MTTSRSRPSDVDSEVEPVGDASVAETPELNLYELHSERTVLTEPGNTDAWIATDLTADPGE